MFFSVKAVALCRRVISFNRGCLQVPGLSTAGAALTGVEWTGVDMTDLRSEMPDSILQGWLEYLSML